MLDENELDSAFTLDGLRGGEVSCLKGVIKMTMIGLSWLLSHVGVTIAVKDVSCYLISFETVSNGIDCTYRIKNK